MGGSLAPSASLAVDPTWASSPSPARYQDLLQPHEAKLGDESWPGPGKWELGNFQFLQGE